MLSVEYRLRMAATALCLLLSPVAAASDGEADVAGAYPAAAAYYEYFVYLRAGKDPQVAFADQSCSASLISEKVLLTAAHCTAFNYTEDIGVAGYFDRAWVSFDTVATGKDFRCFLLAIGVPFVEFMTGELVCDPTAISDPPPVFRELVVAGVNAGVPIAHGFTHPEFLRPALRNDGRAQRADNNLQNATDVGALILAEPVTHIAPLPLRAVGELDGLELVGTPVVSVGYGLNWGKLAGARPTRGLGPMTDLGGGSGVKRIARLGPVQVVHASSLVPRQNVNKGDDTVCFGDSGSPLFLEVDGVVQPVVSGVLSGWTNWCQGSKDPYYRIDQQTAHDFLACIIANQDDPRAACASCSAEQHFGLCDGL